MIFPNFSDFSLFCFLNFFRVFLAVWGVCDMKRILRLQGNQRNGTRHERGGEHPGTILVDPIHHKIRFMSHFPNFPTFAQFAKSKQTNETSLIPESGEPGESPAFRHPDPKQASQHPERPEVPEATLRWLQ